MIALSVSRHSPGDLRRVSRAIGFETADITGDLPFAVTRAEDVAYVHVGGVTIGFPLTEFLKLAGKYDRREFPPIMKEE